MLGTFRLNSISAIVSQVVLGNFGLYKIVQNPNNYSTPVDDNYGFRLAMSNSYFAVGARSEDDATGTGSGAAYIHNLSDGSVKYTFTNPNVYTTSTSDNFGEKLALTDSYAVIAATGEDDALGTFSGVIYVYDLSTGSLLYTKTNPNAYGTTASDQFGFSVAISSQYFAAGAIGEDDATGTSSGRAYLFNLSDGSIRYTFNDPNVYSTTASDQFGAAMAMTDNYIAITAPGEKDAGGTLVNSGAVYVFNLSDNSLKYTFVNPNTYNTNANDNFGTSVALTDSYIIIGASGEKDAAGNVSSGIAYVYDMNDGSLKYTFENPNVFGTTVNDQFGQSVAISSLYAAVGAPTEDSGSTNTGNSSGVVYVYELLTGTLIKTITNPNYYMYSGDYSKPDSFGLSIAISDLYLLSSAYNESISTAAYSGLVYLYNRDASTQIANPTAPTPTFAISPSLTSVNEGGTLTYTITTTNVPDGTVLYPRFLLAGVDATATDITGLVGSVTISGNTASIPLTIVNDLTTEGAQTLATTLYYEPTFATTLATATNVTINDTSTTPVFTTMSFVASATSSLSTITIPATATTDDYAILFQNSTSITDVAPSGWTLINSQFTTGLLTSIYYRKLTAGQGGTSVTGVTGTTRKAMLVFRGNGPVTSITISTPGSQATTAAPTNQTISSQTGAPSVINFAAYSSTGAITTRGWVGGTPSEVASFVTSGVYVKYLITNGTSTSAVISMTDGGTNILQSFSIKFNA